MASDREWLKSQYKSPAWAKRVDKMDDGQVSAIVLRIKNNTKKK